MANNNFMKGKWVKVFLADVIDSAPYIKASKSYFAAQLKGKKVGDNCYCVLRDSGKVTDGLAIKSGDIKDIDEKQVKITLKNKKNCVALDVLEEITEIEDFKTEIADTYGVHLGAEIQKDVIASTIFDASTASVNSNGWVALSQAIAHLKASRVGGKIVGFLDPVAESTLSVNALNNWHFNLTPQGQKMYADASIGTFQQAEFVYANDIPVIEGKTLSLTPTAVTQNDADGTVTLTVSAVSSAIPAGTPLTVEGAYACNIVGMKTNKPFAFIVQEDVQAGGTTIKLGRVEVTECGARNCYIEGVGEIADLVGKAFTNMLTDGTKYYVAQVRNTDALAFENVEMADLKGAENTTITLGGIKLKVTAHGDYNEMENNTRWDIAYGAKIVDNRMASLAYMEI